MALPEDILNRPWPEREQTLRLDGMKGLPPEEKERLRSENHYLRGENARRRQQAHDEKLTASPILSVTLTAQDEAVTSGKLAVSVHVRYEQSPDGQHRPIIVKMDLEHFQSTFFGQYQIFSNPECSADSCLPFHRVFSTMRPERDENCNFVRPTDVPIDATWTLLRPGDQVTYEAELDLTCNQGWKETLRAGQDYWLKYGFWDSIIGGKPGVKLWRFGTLEEWEGKSVPIKKDTWIPIPLGTSNAVHLRVVSIAGSIRD